MQPEANTSENGTEWVTVRGQAYIHNQKVLQNAFLTKVSKTNLLFQSPDGTPFVSEDTLRITLKCGTRSFQIHGVITKLSQAATAGNPNGVYIEVKGEKGFGELINFIKQNTKKAA